MDISLPFPSLTSDLSCLQRVVGLGGTTWAISSITCSSPHIVLARKVSGDHFILAPSPATWLKLCRVEASIASRALMTAVLAVGQCLHSQPVALEGQWFLSGSCSIDFTLKIILHGICVRGRQRCQLCSRDPVAGERSHERELCSSSEGAGGTVYVRGVHQKCIYLLAGCGQRLHNACQHTLPGSGTSEGCQTRGSHCSDAVLVSSS